MEITTRKIPVSNEPENELFGIWKDRKDTDDVEHFVRNIRKKGVSHFTEIFKKHVNRNNTN